MNLDVNAIVHTKVEVDALSCLYAIRRKLIGNGPDLHIHEGKLCDWEDVGYHKSEYERKVISEDTSKVLLFESIKRIEDALRGKPTGEEYIVEITTPPVSEQPTAEGRIRSELHRIIDSTPTEDLLQLMCVMKIGNTNLST